MGSSVTAKDVEAIATALNKYITDQGDPFDNIFSKCGIVRYFMEKDLAGKGEVQRVNRLDGGNYIEHPLEYAVGDSAQFFDGLDVITFTTKETITNTRWEWKHIVQTLTLDNKEILKKKGNAGILADYVGSKLRNAHKSLRTSINTALMALSPATDEFDTIPTIVADDPTVSVSIGGINQNTYSWWRNQTVDSTAASYDSLMKEIIKLRNTCAYNSQDDAPDLCLTDQIVWEYMDFWRMSKGTHTFIDEQMSNLLGGMDVGKFRGMTVIWDNTIPDSYSGTAYASRTYGSVYLLNSEYLRFNAHKDRVLNLSDPIDLFKAKGQDATGWAIFLMGNFTCSNRNKQGVLAKISLSLTS